MAELIPLEYRIQVARQDLIHRWISVGMVAAVIAGAGLISAYAWHTKQAKALAALEKQYQSKTVLITQAKTLQAKRVDLASRMQMLQSIQSDNVVLSLLKDISDGFSDSDCLQFLQIDAHDPQAAKGLDHRYSVRVRGITANDTTHSQLLQRLTEIGKKAQPSIDVPLGEKQLKTVPDGEVTVFDITCQQPSAKDAPKGS